MRLHISLMAPTAVMAGGRAWPARAAIPNGDFSDDLTGWTGPLWPISIVEN